MTETPVRDFFAPKARRTHNQTAALLGQTEHWLSSWIRRYAPTVAPKVAAARGKGNERVQRLYPHDAVVVFRFAYALHDAGFATNIAVSLALRVYDELSQTVIKPWLRNQGSEQEIGDDLLHRFALIRRKTGAITHVSTHRADFLEQGQNAFAYDGVVTTFACGQQLIALIDLVARQDAESAAAESNRKAA